VSLERERDAATEIALAGGELLREEVRRPGGPRGSGSKAPVDDAICALVVERLSVAFPHDAIVSEELPPRPGSSGRAWHVDPHDGTKHFLRGARDTSVSIGLVESGRLLLGVVHVPNNSALLPAGLLADWAEGLPLRRDGRPVTLDPRPPEDLRRGGRILVSPGLRDAALAWNRDVVAPCELVRCGSPATRMALVAVGEALAGVTLRVRLASWDYAAGQALVEAAGGALVGTRGLPLRWDGTEPQDTANDDFFSGRSAAVAAELARRYREGLEAGGL
jgi:fructose-1,6-bisphosphatase/inositol monophosphatase family enzyme